MIRRLYIAEAITKTLLMFRTFFSGRDAHVRISEKGRDMLNNRKLASKVADTIIANKHKLMDGDSVRVDDADVYIELTTAIKEIEVKESK